MDEKGKSIDLMDAWVQKLDGKAMIEMLSTLAQSVQNHAKGVKDMQQYFADHSEKKYLSDEKYRARLNTPEFRVRTLRSIRGRLVEMVLENPQHANGIFKALDEAGEKIPAFSNDAQNLLWHFTQGDHRKAALGILQAKNLVARKMLEQIEEAEAQTLKQLNK